MDFIKYLFNQNNKAAEITVVNQTTNQDSEMRKLQAQLKIPDVIIPGEGQGLFVSSMSALRRIDDRIFDETKVLFEKIIQTQRSINTELMKAQKQIVLKKSYDVFEKQLALMQVQFNQIKGEIRELESLL